MIRNGYKKKNRNIDNYKYSVFLITVNPNIPIRKDNTAELAKMEIILDKLGDFLLGPGMQKIIKFRRNGDNWDTTDIQVLDERLGVVEYGEKNKNPHLHLTFGFRHNTNIQVDRNYIQTLVQGLLKTTHTPHINIRFGASLEDFENYKAYVEKTMPDDE